MEEINSNNVLEFWRNATIEQQKANLDRVFELIDSNTVLEMWKNTKKEVKSQRPDLIIRIIKEKLENGKIYKGGLWENTPQDVQEQTIEEVLQLYKNKFMIKAILAETHESVKKSKKEILAKSIWNELAPETQKRKIKETLQSNEPLKVFFLMKITDEQETREILDESIKEENIQMIILNWSQLPEKIQLEYFQRVMKMCNNSEVIWKCSTEQVQRNNFHRYLQEMNGNINKIINMIQDSKLPRAETVEYISQEYQGEQFKEIMDGYLMRSRGKREYVVDMPALELLKGKIYSDVEIKLQIKNASELTVEKLEELSKYFNIASIQMRDENLDIYQETPYDVETYKKCRVTIDELLDGIDVFQNLETSDREFIIFGEVIKRLVNHMNYDYVALKKLNDKTATQIERRDCANMVGGLLNNTCVCSGYAEIVRNVFACCGIEVKYISGENINSKEPGHAWNQIELEGNWYNMDLTWDRDRILEGEPPKYLLKNDYDFKDHDQYDTEECNKEQCHYSIPKKVINKYLNEKLEMPIISNDAKTRVRSGEIKNKYKIINESVSAENSEKREEQWTNEIV